MTETKVKYEAKLYDSCPAAGFPEEERRHYTITRNGIDTGYEVVRYGTDAAELLNLDGYSTYLSSNDLRRALPEACRIIRRRIDVVRRAG